MRELPRLPPRQGLGLPAAGIKRARQLMVGIAGDAEATITRLAAILPRSSRKVKPTHKSQWNRRRPTAVMVVNQESVWHGF
jgi:hypothetical protein